MLLQLYWNEYIKNMSTFTTGSVRLPVTFIDLNVKERQTLSVKQSPVFLGTFLPIKLHSAGSTRCWRARAKLSSSRSHSSRGIRHSSSSSAPSRPSVRPAVLTWRGEGSQGSDKGGFGEGLEAKLL